MPEQADRMMHFPQPGGSGATSGAPMREFTNTRTRRLDRIASARSGMVRDWRHTLGHPQLQTDVLQVGPVLAEFGHELMTCGIARATAKLFEKVIVTTLPARHALYADFANEFIPHDMDCECTFLWPRHDCLPTREHICSFEVKGAYRMPLEEYYPGHKADFVVYGAFSKEWKDVVVLHARSRAHVPARNWPMENWVRLIRELRNRKLADRIVCIGTQDAAHVVPGTEDARGFPLKAQMGVLRSARYIIGPSSGPMHLASLCKCPQVVWCGGPRSEYCRIIARYVRDWNPFGTPVVAVPVGGWRPAVASVLQWVEQLQPQLSKEKE